MPDDKHSPILSAIAGNIPVVGGLIQGALDARQSRENTRRTIEANKQMAEYAYSKDLEMWNRGNTYNAPQAQMDRLKSAGLNPNLVYGSGAVAGQASGTLPKYNAPTMDYSHVLPTRIGDAVSKISQYQDFAVKQAQIDNLNAQRHAIYEDTEIKKLEVQKRLKFNEWLPKWLTNRDLLQGQQIGESGQRQDVMSKTSRMLDQKIQQEEYKTAHQGELFTTQMDALKAGTAERRRRIEESLAMQPYKQADLETRADYARRKSIGQNISNLVGYGSLDDIIGKTYNQNQKLVQETENKRLQNEWFTTKMFGEMGLQILNKVKGGPVQTKVGTGPKVDPKNKAWQKDAESHSEWMKRVNPGAK